VDDKSEYEDMVGKILEKKPKKVTISVDMADVKKGCQKAQVRGVLLYSHPLADSLYRMVVTIATVTREIQRMR
jgi:hypothetical protein